MTYQKNPKQKSSYPAILGTFEKKKQMHWIKTKLRVGPKINLRSGFTPSARKVPN